MTKKKILMIVIPIAAVVFLGIIFAILFFATDIFKSDEEQFWTYMAQNKDITKILENDKLALQSDFKNTNSYNGTGNLTFSLTQGENSSKTFNVVTTERHDANNGRTYADATLKNGDINLFNVSVIKCPNPTTGDVYAVKSTDVVDAYVGFRNAGLKQLAAKYNISTDLVPDTINLDDYTNVLELTDEQKQHIYDTYLPIIQNNIDKDNYAKTNQDVQIDGETYNANVYAAQLTGDQFKQILLDCLNTLKADTETMVLISNKAQTLNMGIEYTDMTNLTMKINNIIDTINNLNLSNNTTTIYVYENYDETIRTVIDIENFVQITYDRLNGKQILTIDYTQGSLETIASNITNSANTEIVGGTDNTMVNNISDGTNTTLENSITEGNTVELTDDSTNTTENENQISNDTVYGVNNIEENTVIDLNTDATTTNQDNQEVTRLVITKTLNDQNTSNNITYIPNINSESTNNVSITYSMSAVANNTINNSYNITMTTSDTSGTNTTSIDYTTNTVSAAQVEEIQELTDSNTVIANNYDANQFTTFMTQWLTAFEQVFSEKMATIGMGDESIAITEQMENQQQNAQEGVDTTDQ